MAATVFVGMWGMGAVGVGVGVRGWWWRGGWVGAGAVARVLREVLQWGKGGGGRMDEVAMNDQGTK